VLASVRIGTLQWWRLHLRLRALIRDVVIVGSLVVDIRRVLDRCGGNMTGRGLSVRVRVRAIHLIIAADAWHQRFRWRVMEILGLLSNTVMASILEASLDAPLTRSFVS